MQVLLDTMLLHRRVSRVALIDAEGLIIIPHCELETPATAFLAMTRTRNSSSIRDGPPLSLTKCDDVVLRTINSLLLLSATKVVPSRSCNSKHLAPAAIT